MLNIDTYVKIYSMIERCGNCTGPTREACDAILADVRAKAISVLGKAVKDVTENTLAGLFTIEDEMMAFTNEIGERFSSIGCSLDDETLNEAYISELIEATDQADIFPEPGSTPTS